MSRKLKITILAFLAFTGGMLVQAKLHAQAQLLAKASLRSPGPEARPKIVRVGKASWYSERSPGINKRTANNEIFDDAEMTCAMWGVPFNQKVKVTNISNGKSIVLRVNDRGPHRRYVRKGRIIDLTKHAFKHIGGLKEGVINVEVEFL